MAENTPAAETNKAAVADAQEVEATTPENQTPEVPESFSKELEGA